jgi:hypothetical protein
MLSSRCRRIPSTRWYGCSGSEWHIDVYLLIFCVFLIFSHVILGEVEDKGIIRFGRFLHLGHELLDAAAQGVEAAIEDGFECLWRGTEQLNRCPGVGIIYREYLDDYGVSSDSQGSRLCTRESSSSLSIGQKLG